MNYSSELIIFVWLKNICIKGPVAGLMPKYFDIIVGKLSKNSIKEDQPIKWEDI